jgi:hypothetical protein
MFSEAIHERQNAGMPCSQKLTTQQAADLQETGVYDE